MADGKFDRGMHSITTMLGSVDHKYVQACSISTVPEQLRKSKKEAYMPKEVAIGPLHRGTRKDLLFMEDIKWRCMLSLLHRLKKEDAEERLKECSEAILQMDEVVRASYNVDDIKFNSYDLAKVMLLDGCFLLELFISISKSSGRLSAIPETIKFPGLGAEVGKREEVLSDLTVLENQIPLLIVVKLYTVLFPEVFKDPKDDESKKLEFGGRKIKELALSLFGYSPDSFINDGSITAHVLEVVHSFITGNLGEGAAESKSSQVEERQESDTSSKSADREKAEEIQESSDSLIDVDNTEIKGSEVNEKRNKDEKGHLEVKFLKRCATRLQAAGVAIKPPDSKPSDKPVIVNNNPAESRFDFDIKFSCNPWKLEIPPLHITETTEVKWRNFIAWEQSRKKHANFKALGTRISCKFSWYALFFKGLICCVHDIQLLRDRGVIVVHDANDSDQASKKKKKMSNEDLMNLFDKITDGVQDVQIGMDSKFIKLFEDLNSYSPTVDCAKEKGIIIWHYWRRFLSYIWYICRNWYGLLIRDHIPTVWKLVGVIAATVLLGLTIAQTVFSARSQ